VTALTEWENFYVIVGSSAGALIGLQFVVMTLVADKRVATSEALGSAFGTPNIIHFSAVLLLSALVSAPWHGIGAVAVLLGLVSLSGLVYVVIVVWRLRSQAEYHPVFEDWLFHVLLPFAAYVALIVSALIASSHLGEALFAIGAAALLLLFDGIHNAWDGVAYHLFTKRQ
jgi:predicted membrane-bound spermidine synthase